MGRYADILLEPADYSRYHRVLDIVTANRESLATVALVASAVLAVLFLVSVVVLLKVRIPTDALRAPTETAKTRSHWLDVAPYVVGVFVMGALLYRSDALDSQELGYFGNGYWFSLQIETNLANAHSLLYPTVVWLLERFFGLGKDALRWMSFAFFIMSIILVFKVTLSVSNRLTAHVTTLITCVSPLLWYYAFQIEPYIILFFLSLLLINAIIKTQGTGVNRSFFVVSIIGLYTHVAFSALVGAALILQLGRARFHRDPLWWRRFLRTTAILFLAVVPQGIAALAVNVSKAGQFQAEQFIAEAYLSHSGAVEWVSLREMAQAFSLLQRFHHTLGWDSLLMLLLAVLGAVHWFRESGKGKTLALMALLAPALMFMYIYLLNRSFVGSFGGYYPLFRHHMAITPIYVLVVGSGLHALLSARWRPGGPAVGVIVILVLVGLRGQSLAAVMDEDRHPDVAGAMQFVRSELQDEDVLSFTPTHWVQDDCFKDDVLGSPLPERVYPRQSVEKLPLRTSQYMRWVVMPGEHRREVGWGFFDVMTPFTVGLRSLFIDRVWVIQVESHIAGQRLFSDAGYERLLHGLRESGFQRKGGPFLFHLVSVQLFERPPLPVEDWCTEERQITAGLNDLPFLRGTSPPEGLPAAGGVRQLHAGSRMRFPSPPHGRDVVLRLTWRRAAAHEMEHEGMETTILHIEPASLPTTLQTDKADILVEERNGLLQLSFQPELPVEYRAVTVQCLPVNERRIVP
jgi:hypothetical protein